MSVIDVRRCDRSSWWHGSHWTTRRWRYHNHDIHYRQV